MKSKNMLVTIALLSLIMAAASAATLWGDISSPVKIAMFAFGFSSGVAAGTLNARRVK